MITVSLDEDVGEFLDQHELKLPPYLREGSDGPVYFQKRSYDRSERKQFERFLKQSFQEGRLEVKISRIYGSENGSHHCVSGTKYNIYEDVGESKRWDECDQPPFTILRIKSNSMEYELVYEDLRMSEDRIGGSRKIFQENPSVQEFLSHLEEELSLTVTREQD